MVGVLDSGSRTEFASGAVRDIQEGKGRCDLLPWDVIAYLLWSKGRVDSVAISINAYIRTGNTDELYRALVLFSKKHFGSVENMLLEVSVLYEDGCKKYGERNWEKGIDLHSLLNSAGRHYLKFRRGDVDERHDRAFCWNILGALWTHVHRPELIDLPFATLNRDMFTKAALAMKRFGTELKDQLS